MSTETTSMTVSRSRWHRIVSLDAGILGGIILLALLSGTAIGNSWATHNALDGQAKYFQKDCTHRVIATKQAATKTGINIGYQVGMAQAMAFPLH